jgi:tetratricopeptide (TPR) repeat protein
MVIALTSAKLGRLDDAIEAAKKSVELKPAYVESNLVLGELLEKKGLRNEALLTFQTAFGLASDDPRPNFKLAWLYIRMGNKDGAWRNFDILKGIVPNEVENLERCIIAHFGPRR